MDNNNKNMINNSGKIWAGLFVIVVGCLLLVDNLWLNIPKWIFSWHTFLIAFGLLIGVKNKFRGGGWFIMILVGTYFTLQRTLPENADFNKILFPGVIIILGLFLIFKPKSNCRENNRFLRKRQERWLRRQNKWQNRFGSNQMPFEQENATSTTAAGNTQNEMPQTEDSRNDFIDSVNVFGGSQQIIYSKNFKGGEIVAVFGGCDVNLTQADFEGEIVLEVTAVFGGAKIIIPQGWLVKHEVTAILGGLDDKRGVIPIEDGFPRKVLIIRGLAMFGGIEIKNY